MNTDVDKAQSSIINNKGKAPMETERVSPVSLVHKEQSARKSAHVLEPSPNGVSSGRNTLA